MLNIGRRDLNPEAGNSSGKMPEDPSEPTAPEFPLNKRPGTPVHANLPTFSFGGLTCDSKFHLNWHFADELEAGRVAITPIGGGERAFGKGAFFFEIPPVAIITMEAEICAYLAELVISMGQGTKLFAGGWSSRPHEDIVQDLTNLLISNGCDFRWKRARDAKPNSVSVQARGVDALTYRAVIFNGFESGIGAYAPKPVAELSNAALKRALALVVVGGACQSWVKREGPVLTSIFFEDKGDAPTKGDTPRYEVSIFLSDMSSQAHIFAYAHPTVDDAEPPEQVISRVAVDCEKLFTSLSDDPESDLRTLCRENNLILDAVRADPRILESMFGDVTDSDTLEDTDSEEPDDAVVGTHTVQCTTVWQRNINSCFFVQIDRYDPEAEESGETQTWMTLRLSGLTHPAIEIDCTPLADSGRPLSELVDVQQSVSSLLDKLSDAASSSLSDDALLYGAVREFLTGVVQVMKPYQSGFSIGKDPELEHFDGGFLADIFTDTEFTPPEYARLTGYERSDAALENLISSDVAHHIVAKLRNELYFRVRTGDVDRATFNCMIETPLDDDGLVCDVWIKDRSNCRFSLQSSSEAVIGSVTDNSGNGSYLVGELLGVIRNGSAQACLEWIEQNLDSE